VQSLLAEFRTAVRKRRGFRTFVSVAAFLFVFSIIGLFVPINTGIPLWSSDSPSWCSGSVVSHLDNKTERLANSPPVTSPFDGRVMIPGRKNYNTRPSECRKSAEAQVTKLAVVAALAAIAPFAVMWITRKPDEDTPANP